MASKQDELPEALVDLVDEHFPKGECKERGQAMVMLAFFYMWHKSDTNKQIAEVIGEDELIEVNGHFGVSHRESNRNQLRAEQRARLATLRKEK